MTNGRPVMPAFLFVRQSQVELEAGYILAGHLIVGIPKRSTLGRRDRRMIAEIIDHLKAAALSGALPANGHSIGWHGARPADAVARDDAQAWTAWEKRCTAISVRVDPRQDRFARVAREALKQEGVIHEGLEEMGLLHGSGRKQNGS